MYTSAAGDVADLCGQAGILSIEGVGRAELAGEPELLVRDVDDDDGAAGQELYGNSRCAANYQVSRRPRNAPLRDPAALVESAGERLLVGPMAGAVGRPGRK